MWCPLGGGDEYGAMISNLLIPSCVKSLTGHPSISVSRYTIGFPSLIDKCINMAGGTSIWASKDAKTDPKEIFNARLVYLLITVAWAGCFYGFDVGNIGGILTLPSFENAFGLSNLTQREIDGRKGTIAAMLAAGGSLGALLAAPTSDFLGRKRSVFAWGLVFIAGAALQMIADYNVLLAGRFIGGMGVGASSMLSPQFLAENSPKSIRGSMTATYNLMIVTSLMLAFWVNYGVSRWTGPDIEHYNSQWRASMGTLTLEISSGLD
jgi:MFS family permease